jgi:manganese oxidase
VGLPDLYAKAKECPVPEGSGVSLAAPCPEAVSAADIGMAAVNYRNEPIGLRVRAPGTNTQATGLKGDLSFAYQSRTDRAHTAFNTQPGFYPPLTSGLYPGDPFTPLLRAFEGDQIKIRTLVGAHEEPHNFTVHGLKWLHEPDDPNSGYRNSQMMGISEWFDIELPRVPSLIDGRFADFLYKPSAAVESQWTGAWGILRIYRNNDNLSPSQGKFQLMPLTTYNYAAKAPTPDTLFQEITVEQARAEQVPGGDVDPATVVATDESASTATTTTAAFEAATIGSATLVSPGVSTTSSPTPVGARAAGTTIRVACPFDRLYKNYEIAAVAASEVLQNDPIGMPGLVYNPRSDSVTGPSGSFAGPLFDPTGIMFVYKSDLTFVGGRPRLNPNVRREPLILRAVSGDCLKVKLWNYLPANYADAPGYSGVNMIVEGFNQNDIQPSRQVSLHPQLVFYDVQRSDGSNVGLNPSQFGLQTVAPNAFRTYYWYAGDVRGTTSIPIEYGATGLTSSDPIKHSNKGLMGSLIVEPATAQWTYDVDSNGQTTRASAKISSTNVSFTSFQEFAFVIQDDVNLQYSKGTAVPNLEIDDDPENSGQKAVNYRAEPLWFRGGWTPETPFSETKDHLQFDDILHNNQVGGDPETPVFEAVAGTPLRLRVVHPSGHTQSHVFEVHGHPWLAMPYTTNSTVIGNNTTSPWIGSRGGVGPTDHFDALVFDKAGGKFNVTGDYLYRSYGGPRMDAGIWGVIRILP